MDYKYDENGDPIAACPHDVRIRWRERDEEANEDAGLWMTCDACEYVKFVGTLKDDDRVHWTFLDSCAREHDFNHSSFFRPRLRAA